MLLLFVPLRDFEDTVVGACSVVFAVCIDDLDVDYAVRPPFPESSDAVVSSVAVGKGGVGWVGVWVWCGFRCGLGH